MCMIYVVCIQKFTVYIGQNHSLSSSPLEPWSNELGIVRMYINVEFLEMIFGSQINQLSSPMIVVPSIFTVVCFD